MKFFVDSTDVQDIKKAKALGLADGVTTNPTLIAKSGRDLKTVITEITDVIEGPVLAEPVCDSVEEIVKEGRQYASWAENVVVKIAFSEAGLEATRILSGEGINCALTLVFTANQALLAAKAGAAIICPFVGRLDDISSVGMDLIAEIMDVYDNYPDIETEVIAASLRNANHVLDCASVGADGVTIPFKVVQQMMAHPLTEIGIQKFKADWAKV